MTTYNGHRMRRQRARRARRALWNRVQPYVLLVELALIVAAAWYLAALAGMV
jgi:hypothetical protein